MKKRKHQKDMIKDIAIQRIEKLFELAEKVSQKDEKLANRYVELAYNIALRTRIRLPKKFKYRICRKCRSYLIPGKTLSIRLKPKREPHIVLKCLICGYTRRIPYKKGLNKSNKYNISSGVNS